MRTDKFLKNSFSPKKSGRFNKPKIVRNVFAVVTGLMAIPLILLFGLSNLLGYSVCCVENDDARSVYSGGSVAFVKDVEPESLQEGDIAVYYSGANLIGVTVISRDDNMQMLYTMTDEGATMTIKYSKISGKGSSFCLPFACGYVNWIAYGSGVKVSVIAMCVSFAAFAFAALLTRDEIWDIESKYKRKA